MSFLDKLFGFKASEPTVKVSTGLNSPLIKAVNWEKSLYYNKIASNAIMHNGARYIEMPKSDYDAMMKSVVATEEENKRLTETAAANNKGIDMEKKGDIDGAIAVYEENISKGYPATHSYQRLMILYRKRGDYDNEIRVIKAAINVFCKIQSSVIPEWERRMEKAESLRAKRDAK